MLCTLLRLDWLGRFVFLEGIIHSSKTATSVSRVVRVHLIRAIVGIGVALTAAAATTSRRLEGRVVAVQLVCPVVNSRLVGRVVWVHLVRVVVGIGAALNPAAAATALSVSRVAHLIHIACASF